MDKPKNNVRRFWYHYNKPESKRQGCNVLTLHWHDTCYLVNSMEVSVPTETHNRNSQPHCVIRGWAGNVSFMTKGGKVHALVTSLTEEEEKELDEFAEQTADEYAEWSRKNDTVPWY